MAKKFEEMTGLEKLIYNEVSIIEMQEKAIRILEENRSPYIPICTLRSDIEKRKKWLIQLEQDLVNEGHCKLCGDYLHPHRELKYDWQKDYCCGDHYEEDNA